MNSFLSALKTTGAAAAIALALAAAPAMAQSSSEPSASFSIGISNGQSQLSFGVEAPQQGNGNFRHGRNNDGFNGGNDGGFNACLSDRQIIRGLRDYGFQRVEVTDSSRRRAEVVGRWGRWDYVMRVSKCTGEVNIVDRYRRGNNRNGFGLQFSFN